MKKKLLTLLVLLMTAVSGSWAQDERTSHWPDFNPTGDESQLGLVASITIDGEIITADYEGWDQLEVAAFVGDECRSAEYHNGDINSYNFLYNGYVEDYGDPFPIIDGMVIIHNGVEQETVTFKMYNHATGVEYTTCTVTLEGEETSILTSDDDHYEGWIDSENPIFLNFTSPAPATVTQTIALAAGENWFSTNVEVSLEDLQSALVEATGGTTSITINSQGSGNSTYVPSKTTWRGKLTTLDVSQMYMIKVEAACEITLEGAPADPAEHPVTIKHGFNWIGMPLSGNITVTDAFAGFAMDTDQVISSDGTANYRRGRWNGSSLTTLEPGKGYIYNSVHSEDRTLVFPTAN